MKVDYLIVGQGIAGSVMALTLEQRGKTVAVLDDPGLSSSSQIAAGVYNPFNFRRSVPVWRAGQAIETARAFYSYSEKRTGGPYHHPKKIIRVFESEHENGEWEKYLLLQEHPFAQSMSRERTRGSVLTPFGSGIIDGGGMVNTGRFVDDVWAYFYNRGYYLQEKCNHQKFFPNEKSVIYDSRIEADHVIFCEGHLAKENPYFDSRVVAPTKGELIHVSIPGFNQAEVINGQVYLAPLGDDKYVCGATFNPGKSDEEITEAGRDDLIRKLKTIIDLPFEVIGHFAGVRPAGRDRKPVLGRSRNHRNLSIFNGFGSKAVLHAPFLAQMLADHLENGAELAPEINVARFKVY